MMEDDCGGRELMMVLGGGAQHHGYNKRAGQNLADGTTHCR